MQNLIVEDRYHHAGVYPVSVSRRALALLIGPQGRLYSLAFLKPDHIDPTTEQDEELSRQYQLFVLGLRCLELALAATLLQAKTYLRTLLRRR